MYVLILILNQNKSFGVYSEAHFVLNWHHIMLELNPSMDKSQHVYVVIYKGYPVYWALKLQIFITLSSCISEWVGLF